MKDIFSCIPFEEQFSENNDKIMQSLQQKYNIYHPLFVKWATHLPTNKRVSSIINNTYTKCEAYLDKKFIKIFPRQDEFLGRLWELFLCDYLLRRKFILKQDKKEIWTPDFCILYKNTKIWIEARVPAPHHSIKDLQNKVYHLDDISIPRYLRLSSSFCDKSKHWKEIYTKNECKNNEPFIIAINGNQIDAWASDKGMLGILYNVWLTQISQVGIISYQKLPRLEKTNWAPIETGYFLGHLEAHVSGVIFLQSQIDFYNKKMVVEKENFQFIPNINAKNPLPKDFIKQLNLHIPIKFQ